MNRSNQRSEAARQAWEKKVGDPRPEKRCRKRAPKKRGPKADGIRLQPCLTHQRADGSFIPCSWPRMRLLVGSLHGIGCNVRVNLRCRQVLVPQQLLDHANVRATVEEVGREAVP